jgi:hypothetical protein
MRWQDLSCWSSFTGRLPSSKGRHTITEKCPFSKNKSQITKNIQTPIFKARGA